MAEDVGAPSTIRITVMLSFRGDVQVEIIDELAHQSLPTYSSRNTLTLTYRTGWAAWLTGSALNPPTAIGVGSGTASATNISASSLQYELMRKTVGSEWGSNLDARFSAIFATGELTNIPINELGLFSSPWTTGWTWNGANNMFGLERWGSATPWSLFAIAPASITGKSPVQRMQITWRLSVWTASAL